jgi:hypothetical protein
MGKIITYNNRLINFKKPTNPLWDDLKAYYKADNTSDDSKGTNNGVLTNGGTYGTGIINQGFSLDGVNDFVNMGDTLDFDGSTPFSISMWVYLDSLSGVRMLISKQSTASSKVGYSIFYYNGYFDCILANNRSSNNIYVKAFTTTPSINTWYNIVLTYDGSKNGSGITFNINSVDEVLVTEDNLTGSISNSIDFNIGARNSITQYTSGIIDEVGIWDRVLTPTEVTELYNSGVGKQYPN